MKNLVAAASLLIASTGAGLADDCADKFARVLISSQNMKPAQAQMVSRMKGQKPIESEFLTVSPDHYMTRPTKPKGPWVLAFDGARYQSADEGKSWQKIQTFDKDKARADAIKMMKDRAATVRNAVCGEEELNGVMHETLEADTINAAPTKFEIHSKYWVNRKAGDFVTRSDTTMKSSAFEMFTTQTWKAAPGLTLPKPE